MTDCELLELAAKAAGFHFHGVRVGSNYFNCYVSTTGNTDDWFVWNPLTDDGDALRLAVKILNWPHGGRAFDNAVTAMFAVGQLPDDPYAATRRAIVRAAAEIGKAL